MSSFPREIMRCVARRRCRKELGGLGAVPCGTPFRFVSFTPDLRAGLTYAAHAGQEFGGGLRIWPLWRRLWRIGGCRRVGWVLRRAKYVLLKMTSAGVGAESEIGSGPMNLGRRDGRMRPSAHGLGVQSKHPWYHPCISSSKEARLARLGWGTLGGSVQIESAGWMRVEGRESGWRCCLLQ